VLKLRDGWAPFEREKLLPRSYNLPVGPLVKSMSHLVLKKTFQYRAFRISPAECIRHEWYTAFPGLF
jgi:hypothetical protein